ncbi:peptidoglycan-binding protein [Sporolactobacillus mangiferae]|uniref:peptidoglycan-binding protein n=1 Tax=Sporolactobacillus mangiferae TaxID=2940498 RepID=UPI0024B39C78|nr:peptidoglycan-binding protein [Sporolactobacillus mangiferae]
MYSGTALAKSAAVVATFTSTFIILPQNAAAHLTSSNLLYKGTHSDEVKTIQSILKSTGRYPLMKSTGYFGAQTEKAVKQFQRENALDIDGVVGPKTKKELIRYTNKNMDLLSRGAKGNEVAYLQQMLRTIGFKALPVDGYFGVRTEKAVLELQKKTRIHIDGIVGPETWGSIEKQLRHPQPIATSVKPAASKAQVQQKIKKTTPSVRPSKRSRIIRKTDHVSAVREFYANSTAYTARCNGCSGTTATGINLLKNPDTKVIAVDPSVIPLGTKLYVEGYGYAVAGDTGGAIKGHKIDVFFNSNSDALQWGRRTVKVKIIE